MDLDKDNDKCFQDLETLTEIFVDAKEGDTFKYINGEYTMVEEDRQEN